MNRDFAEAMRAATRATRAGDPFGATRIIQRALGGFGAPAAAPGRTPPPPQPSGRPLLDPDAEIVEPIEVSPADEAPAPAPDRAPPAARSSQGRRRSLGAVVRALDGLKRVRAAAPQARAAGDPPLPEGAKFLARTFTGAAGARDYRLYLPASTERPRGLVVMLHGCTQDGTDFARGSGMNRVAEAHGLAVAYPTQPRAANATLCWNWFEPAHQERRRGEPAILAELAASLVDELGLRTERVFVAGMSAGGAMATVLGATHPQLFAAVGVHSGLPYRAANDLVSAFEAMQGTVAPLQAGARQPRTIVFHGRADGTVHVRNAERIVAGAVDPGVCRVVRQAGISPAGRTFERTTYTAPDGRVAAERWLVDDLGHAWSGGDASGSFSDPAGPDASAAMARFFLDLADA